ncbi:hypothetical protein [Brevibacterium aurantiacum]|uniref:Transposase DDE domain-containing protein n=2 Tax=Brevibacterium aurantiacum TaxID=273384 RepID=A0A2A3WZT0_BREAU|nr:hypothetical protein [Brevibacterium aurantiacum]MDN5586745.1 hypothetical protein [Brevibacterium sp.]AZL06289.1 hypothetical protein CXR24_12400 [Brevibacterium aurantiacum]AZL09846.1 hypothetical protein CXR26_11925 [Brevibacterium aurantiacum]AZL13496.1 hypothetical protein CXR25_12265 [Brevibacterium aurantiacum]AZT97809.1 hypothetical protein CXR27_13000 [Brevibacterium aurantiacum]
MKLSGYKGHVTNIPRTIVPVRAIIGNYRDLWHVELSFRMSKTELDARPMLHRTGDAIEANLRVVFTALGAARFMQDSTGLLLKKIITTLRPLREFVGVIGDQEITFAGEIRRPAKDILDALQAAR